MNIERVYDSTGYGRLDVDVDALPVARFSFLILFLFLSFLFSYLGFISSFPSFVLPSFLPSFLVLSSLIFCGMAFWVLNLCKRFWLRL